jgi:hypothetical protein
LKTGPDDERFKLTEEQRRPKQREVEVIGATKAENN